jgi:hypothetical protein
MLQLDHVQINGTSIGSWTISRLLLQSMITTPRRRLSSMALATNQGRIVGFLVDPISVHHKYEGEWGESKGSEQLTSCYDGIPMSSLLPDLDIDPAFSGF